MKPSAQLAVVIAFSNGHALHQPAAQDGHPALAAPAFEPQRGFPPLPALTGIGLAALGGSLLDQLLDVGGNRSLNR